MRSDGSRLGGRHSVLWLTRRSSAGSFTVASLAPIHRPTKNRYSTPEAPGHCADGSLDCAVNGLPRMPMFVLFIHTLATVDTLPGPTMSGASDGCTSPVPPRVPGLPACGHSGFCDGP